MYTSRKTVGLVTIMYSTKVQYQWSFQALFQVYRVRRRRAGPLRDGGTLSRKRNVLPHRPLQFRQKRRAGIVFQGLERSGRTRQTVDRRFDPGFLVEPLPPAHRRIQPRNGRPGRRRRGR